MALLLKYIFRLAVSLLFVLDHVSAVWSDFELTSIRDLNGTSAPIFYNIRAKRLKKGIYGIAGTIVINENVSGVYDCKVEMLFSASANDEYKATTLAVTRAPICDRMNTDYRKYIMHQLRGSDVPYSDDKNEDLCKQMEKGTTLTLRNYQFDSFVVPKFIQHGRYKMIMTMLIGDIAYTGFEVIVTLS